MSTLPAPPLSSLTRPVATTSRKPTLWAVGISKLGALYRDIVPEYAAAADIQIIDKGYDEVIDELAAQPAGTVDGIIAAGSNGAYLRERLALPVVLVKVTGFDVMQALARARRISSRIALVSYARPVLEFERFKNAFGLDVGQWSYRNAQDAEDLVQMLRQRGIEAVVGPGLVTELAEKSGMAGIFLYSHDSVHAAFETALEVARFSRIEAWRRERLDTILRHLRDGVIAVDTNERIQSINAPMLTMLGLEAGTSLTGRTLGSVAPELSLQRTLASGEAELETIVPLLGKTYVVNRIPLREQSVLTGAVLTCQDSLAVSRIDRSLRSRHRPRHLVARYRLDDLVGTSPPIERIRTLARHYAATDSTILIDGASGTGKELVAQGIHNASRRADYPFVAINCAAFPETLLESELFGYEEGAFTGARRGGKAGIFETAHNGTLFLDEIGEMPLPLQTRLLRVLQEREVLRLGANEPIPFDVRVIAATHRDLRALVAQGGFREDLYYRLNILRLTLPPLHARRGDIAMLAHRLLERALTRAGAQLGAAQLLAELEPLLQNYAWPGNVRELENVLERIAVSCAALPDVAALRSMRWLDIAPELFGPNSESAAPSAGSASRGLRDISQRSQRNLIRAMLAECGGDRDEVCRRLGISRSTLWRRLRESPGD